MTPNMDDSGYLERMGLLDAIPLRDHPRRVISRAAYDVYFTALARSIRAGTDGVVTDEQLSSLGRETTLSAMELCVLGMWRRQDCGYHFVDRADVERLLEAATAHRECVRWNGARNP